MNSLNQLVIVGGFERPGVKERLHELQTAIENDCRRRGVSCLVMSNIIGCPRDSAHSLPDVLSDNLAKELEKGRMRTSGKALVAVSYGALLALNVLATRRRLLQYFDTALLVDGPLSPAVDVPKPANGMFDDFSVQYEGRVDFAQRTLQALDDIPEEERYKILSLGSLKDTIVPAEAKQLSGVLPFVSLESEGHQLDNKKIEDITRFLAVKLFAQAA